MPLPFISGNPMPVLFKNRQPVTSAKPFGGFWFFYSEMERLGLWPEMTQERAHRMLETSEVPVRGSEDDGG